MTIFQAPKIMIIRHAEKPDGSLAGVKESGEQSKRDLTVRGWQRAGALTNLFGPVHGLFQDTRLMSPQFLFASAPSGSVVDAAGESKSVRSESTIKPLSQRINVAIDLRFGKGQESEVASAAQVCAGPVLICWQHEAILKIADAILGNATTAPRNWPSDRFDIVYLFTKSGDRTYSFDQIPQLLLAGDVSNVIS